MPALSVSKMMSGEALDAKLYSGMYVVEARAVVARACGTHPNKVRIVQGEGSSSVLKDDEKLGDGSVYVLMSAEADDWTAPPTVWQRIDEDFLPRFISQHRLQQGIWHGTDLCGKIGCVVGLIVLFCLVIAMFNTELDCAYKIAMDIKAAKLVVEAPCDMQDAKVRPGQLLHFQDCPVHNTVDIGAAARASNYTQAPGGLKPVFNAFKENLPLGIKGWWMNIKVEHVLPTGNGWTWAEVKVADATGPWAMSGLQFGTWNLSDAVTLSIPGQPMHPLNSSDYHGFQKAMFKSNKWEHLTVNSSNMQLGKDGLYLYSQPGRPSLNNMFHGAQSYDIRVSFTTGAAARASVLATANSSTLTPWLFQKSRWLEMFPYFKGDYSLSVVMSGSKSAKEMIAAQTRAANTARFIAFGAAALCMILPVYLVLWPDVSRYICVDGREHLCLVKLPRASAVALIITLTTILSSHLLVWHPFFFMVFLLVLAGAATYYTINLPDYKFEEDEETTPLVGSAVSAG